MLTAIVMSSKYMLTYHNVDRDNELYFAVTCGANLGEPSAYSLTYKAVEGPKLGLEGGFESIATYTPPDPKFITRSVATPTLVGPAGVFTFLSPEDPYECFEALHRVGAGELAESFSPLAYLKKRHRLPPELDKLKVLFGEKELAKALDKYAEMRSKIKRGRPPKKKPPEELGNEEEFLS